MNATRHEYICRNEHHWTKLELARSKVDPGACPVCGLPARLGAALTIVDRPMFRIEPSGVLHQRSGKLMGDGLYYLVLIRPDLQEEVCARYPLSWDAAVSLAYDLKGLSYSKARRIFLYKADEKAGIHKNLRSKIQRS